MGGHSKDCVLLGSMFGSSYVWKLPLKPRYPQVGGCLLEALQLGCSLAAYDMMYSLDSVKSLQGVYIGEYYRSY